MTSNFNKNMFLAENKQENIYKFTSPLEMANDNEILEKKSQRPGSHKPIFDDKSNKERSKSSIKDDRNTKKSLIEKQSEMDQNILKDLQKVKEIEEKINKMMKNEKDVVDKVNIPDRKADLPLKTQKTPKDNIEDNLGSPSFYKHNDNFISDNIEVNKKENNNRNKDKNINNYKQDPMEKLGQLNESIIPEMQAFSIQNDSTTELIRDLTINNKRNKKEIIEPIIEEKNSRKTEEYRTTQLSKMVDGMLKDLSINDQKDLKVLNSLYQISNKKPEINKQEIKG